jgi:hypothetical protein
VEEPEELPKPKTMVSRRDRRCAGACVGSCVAEAGQ